MTQSTKPHIVIAEDEPATRKLLQRQLENAGYDVHAYGDGRPALEQISGLGSALVLADWGMPEMDGLELCRAIRELEEMNALSNVYVLLVTAHDGKEQIIDGLEAGANDYLTKPYDHGELLARIQVGERMLRLQAELLHRNVEYQKANAQLATLTRKLEELANTDELTGLMNRRCTFERLEQAWALAERDSSPLSCIMIDADKFKRINDTYGHPVGDQVLKDIAAVVLAEIRRPDLFGRVGGEEFVLICPSTPRAGAVVVAERMRQAVARHTTTVGDVSVQMTISCGVAERNAESTHPDDLIRQADELLYRAKEAGRNQTWVLNADGISEPVTGTAAVP